MRNPHILCAHTILHFFRLFKILWGFIWLGYCLNRFITLRRWSNDFRKNPNPKILKNYTMVRIMWGILFILRLYDVLKMFRDFIWLRYCLKSFITLSGCLNDAQKNFKKSTEVENWEGTKNVRILHILRTLVNFWVFLHFDFSGYHLTTF